MTTVRDIELADYAIRTGGSQSTNGVEIVRAVNAAGAIADCHARGLLSVELLSDDTHRSCQSAVPGIQGLDVRVFGSVGILPGRLSVWRAYFRGAVARDNRYFHYHQLQRSHLRRDPAAGMRHLEAFEIGCKHACAGNIPCNAAAEIVLRRTDFFFMQGAEAEAMASLDNLSRIHGLRASHAWSSRGIAYSFAQKYGESKLAYMQCLEADPSDLLARGGLAELSANQFGDAATARHHINHVHSQPLASSSKPLIDCTEACVLLAEHRFDEARSTLERTIPIISRFAIGSPMATGLVRCSQARLAIACAKTGDLSSARKHLRRSLPFLTLHRFEPLTTSARSAVGF